MSKVIIIIIILAYLAFLFGIAYWGEKNNRSKWVNHPWVYVLSLAVYCTAWTYYGSVGIAATKGINFLPIYIGPIIAMPLWIVITKKIIQLSKTHNITSLADFIALRYGNNRSLGALVTLVCLAAILPYMSLQLKAVSETFAIITNQEVSHKTLFGDSTFYIAIILALFAAGFSTIKSDASDKKSGIVFSIAVESTIKLTLFLIIGLYIVFYLFDGTTDLYNKIYSLKPELLTGGFTDLSSSLNWFLYIIISFFAIFLLPRQFQVSIIEYTHKLQLKNAIWGFPLYLLLFNIFVIFIAWAGMSLLGDQVNPDYYALHIPLSQNHTFLAVLVFLGGFSAIISMVVISSIALSTMLSNNIIIPYGFLDTLASRASKRNTETIKNIRRITIFLLIILAYIIYISFKRELPLISIGLISFVTISQLAPSFFIGLYWNRGSSIGAKAGIITGFLIVTYCLVLPFVLETVYGENDFINNGLFGINWLKPYQLFGLSILDPIAHAFFWSLLINTLLYLILSVATKGNYRERNYGELFANASEINSLQENAFVWKGEAYFKDIEELLHRFLGSAKADRAIHIFRKKYDISKNQQLADSRFINFSEKLLTGTIGGASAKVLIASVAKEKPVSLVEVLNILDENKKTRSANKILKAQSDKLIKLSRELKDANQELITQDQLKDSFLDTVAHELKTPITAIQAASEVLQDDDMPNEIRQKFLSNIMHDTQRLTTLINNILNLEKLSSGREALNLQTTTTNSLLDSSIKIIEPLLDKDNIKLIKKYTENIVITCDVDKMTQVFTNILGNALKFVTNESGVITIDISHDNSWVTFTISDNGKGIDEKDTPYIFNKFYQSKNQHLKKPSGSGFGLAICKQIIEMHNGTIYVNTEYKNGAEFIIKIPIENEKDIIS